MICPQCRAEYVDGVDRCRDCEMPLVHASELNSDGDAPPEWAELAVVAHEHEAELIRGFLESEGVPCTLESLVFHAEPVNFGLLSRVRVHVPAPDLTRARRLLESLQSDESTVTAVP